MAAMQFSRCVLQRVSNVRNVSTSSKLYNILPPDWMSDRTPFKHRQFENKDAVGESHLKSLKEKLAEGKNVDEDVHKPVNIGLPLTPFKISQRERLESQKRNRSNRQIEQAARHQTLKVPLDEVKSVWLEEMGANHQAAIIKHYGIYEHLFGGAHFYPAVVVHVSYDYDEESVMPVYLGNRISPQEAQSAPYIEYEADEDSLYTLLMTNPDGHLVDNDSEYLHWMIGNIPGSDVEKGEVLCDYLQPFPPGGTGFHRHIFVLFKQDQKLDFSNYRKEKNCSSLKDRTFKTFEFYREYQEHMTPVSLNFFQSEYDKSVRDVYHNVLNMREPAFEYRHDPPYHPPQKMYPHKQPFDRYYDRYRDKKDLAEEVLKMKLDMISPFAPHPQRPKYPLIHREVSYKPSWLKKREQFMHRRIEQFKDMP